MKKSLVILFFILFSFIGYSQTIQTEIIKREKLTTPEANKPEAIKMNQHNPDFNEENKNTAISIKEKNAVFIKNYPAATLVDSTNKNSNKTVIERKTIKETMASSKPMKIIKRND